MKKVLDKSEVAVASDRLYRSVRKVIQEAHGVVSRVANWAMVESNWRIGFLIVEDEQKGKRKAEYGKAVLKDLAHRLTAEYGSGYDESNLRYMRLFYLAFPIRDALRHELSWTHYRSLTRVPDPIAREWYMNECIASSWGTRDLDRQIATQSYERLLAGVNPDRRRKRKELPLTRLPAKPKSLVPADFIKNPMLLEFLSLPDDNPTVGIVLCSETDQAIARYSILKGNEKLFAVKYKTFLPDEETLRREIEAQKELYRLQLQDMVELNAEASPVCSAHKVKKSRKVK